MKRGTVRQHNTHRWSTGQQTRPAKKRQQQQGKRSRDTCPLLPFSIRSCTTHQKPHRTAMNTRHPQTWQARWPRAGGCEHDTCLRAYSSILVRRTSSCCSDSKPCGSSRHAGDTDMHDNVRMQSRLGCAAAGAGGDDAGTQPHHATFLTSTLPFSAAMVLSRSLFSFAHAKRSDSYLNSRQKEGSFNAHALVLTRLTHVATWTRTGNYLRDWPGKRKPAASRSRVPYTSHRSPPTTTTILHHPIKIPVQSCAQQAKRTRTRARTQTGGSERPTQSLCADRDAT